MNNAVIIGTCAFTGYLFLFYLPTYIEGITPLFRYGLVATVVLLAVLSSTDIRFVKVTQRRLGRSLRLLAVAMWAASGMGLAEMGAALARARGLFREHAPLRDPDQRPPCLLPVLVVRLEQS